MPLFIQIIVYGVIIYILSIPFINLIDEYNEKKDAEKEKAKERLNQDDEFEWDWLEESIKKEQKDEH